MKYCSNCLYPIRTVNLNFNKTGICSACESASKYNQIPDTEWEKRKKIFLDIVTENRKNSESEYDCMIPVSGGKDSYFQAHVIVSELGLKPLFVTYHGNNFIPEADLNRDKMRENFDADHLVFGPSVSLLKKLNRLCFKKMGDMNWHAHCGIFTYPFQVAVKFKIPLLIWGETFWDISGMFNSDDFPEFTRRMRLENNLRGFDWNDMIDKEENIREKDLLWAKFPTDQEYLDSGIRGIAIGNYFKWDPNKHYKLIKKLYNWQESKKPFQRTYRKFSNLDDRYENGVHDLLKFIKFGYGRATDHASKDIRMKYITRSKGIEYVKKYDHIISDDLYHWLEYTGFSEKEFWEIAERFRDPSIWWIEDGKWYKDNIWGKISSYGNVTKNSVDEAKYLKLKKDKS
jgi:N-acetyl sugar amidotransferase